MRVGHRPAPSLIRGATITANPTLLDEPTQSDVPRPPRFLRIALIVFEVGCWATTALLTLFLTLGVVLMIVLEEVPVTARLLDGGSLVQGGGQVESGTIDVVLTGVPLSASWSYVLMAAAAGAAWAVLCVVLARISRGLRFGVPFRSVTPGFLYGLAAVWTGLSIAAPFVMATTQPAMAAAAGVSIPNATFAYTMAADDVVSIVIGPVIAVIVAVLATGSRMWAEHRTLV